MALRDGSVTALAEPLARVSAVAAAACIGALAVAPGVVGRYLQTEHLAWAERLPAAAVAAWLTVGGVIVVLGSFRALVMGVRISHAGVVVRNYFRTYKLSWPEVARFVDGSTPGGFWALNVVTRSGLAVTASGEATGPTVRSDMVTAIRRVAGRYGIRADVYGVQGEWEGPKSRLAPGGLVALAILGLFFAELYLFPGAYHCPQDGCVGG